MDIEIAVPHAPAVLTPGDECRVPVEVCNRSASTASVRLSVARSRAGAWSRAEPPTLDLAAGGCATAEIVFAPPDGTPPTPALQPYTVLAEDAAGSGVAGRGTGLLEVRTPEAVTAELTQDSERVLRMQVTNRGASPVTLRLEASLDPPRGRVHADPAVLDVPRGGSASAQVLVRPRRRLSGRPSRYTVRVAARDAAGDGGPPVATAEAVATARPGAGRRPVLILLCVLVGLGLVAALGWQVARRLPGRGDGSGADRPAAGSVRRPYVLVGVYPRQPAGRSAAEAALSRYTAAGMPVRLVDSTTTDAVADPGGGLYVILHDGFRSVDEARRFCDRFRTAAPKCDVVP